MKKITYLLFALLFGVPGLLVSSGCSSDNDDTTIEEATPALTKEERTDLLFLREEEKLARDVYLYAYDKYQLKISNNISQSEQRHMDEVLTLLEKYDIPDPASNDRGVFSDQVLQKLYDDLTARVDSSKLDALIVGMIIEDLDLNDIEDFKSRTSKEDLLAVYNFLACGSRNHLRAYYGQLLQNSGAYIPQYITQEQFDEIINSNKEQCSL